MRQLLFGQALDAHHAAMSEIRHCIAELKGRKTVAGRHAFAKLRARMSPEARAAAEAVQLDAETDITKVRRAKPMTSEWLRPIPTLMAVIVLASAAPLFWLSGDLGWFLILFFVYLPLILLALLALALASAFLRKPRSRSDARLSCAGIVISLALAFFFSVKLKDTIRFTAWRSAHLSNFKVLSDRPGIIEHWSSDGMAGAEYDSYLVSDPTDTLSDKTKTKIWLNHYLIGFDQPDIRRMAAKYYVIHTYNCPLG